jgi:foldase protein PrsA
VAKSSSSPKKGQGSPKKGQGDRRIVVAAILAVFLVAFFVVVGLAQGIGNPSVPSDDVAVVQDAPDGNITMDQFQSALKQTALRQGVTKVPAPSDPQYAAIRDAAMSDLLSARWVAGEAEERGITVSDTEVTNQLDQIKKQYGGASGFKQLLKQSGFTADEARVRIQIQLLSNEIQKQVVGTNPPPVPQELIQQFYDANKAQLTTPETRDVREIVNKDKAKADQALAALQQDNSAANWKKVAAKYSTDKATSSNGGLRKAVAQGQSEPALDQQIFSAGEGQLIGPFKGQAGYYVIEVDKVRPASVKPLEKVQSQIKQTLAQGLQQQALTDSQKSITDKWVSRTFCASGYVMQLCDNFTPPPSTTPGAPPVISSGAVQPGQTAVFPGQAPAALPQGPQYPQPKAQPSVLGPGGAPQLPPGTTAPPQTAPPSGG